MEASAAAHDVRQTTLTIENEGARVFEGGAGGVPLVLVHGGWAGASAHWSSVWNQLAERHRVIAPDLPGVGDASRAGLGSVAAYARFLRDVMDALGVETAWFVGNSFGASVVGRFAIDFPDRCRGLVFVNGFPMPETPALVQKLGHHALGRRLVKWVETRIAYTPAALTRAFVDPANVPDEIRRVVNAPSPPQVDTLTDVLVEGGGARQPFSIPPVLVWGEDDRLPGTTRRSARKLEASLPGAKLMFVPRAGHMPQVENPRAFVDTLEPLLATK